MDTAGLAVELRQAGTAVAAEAAVGTVPVGTVAVPKGGMAWAAVEGIVPEVAPADTEAGLLVADMEPDFVGPVGIALAAGDTDHPAVAEGILWAADSQPVGMGPVGLVQVGTGLVAVDTVLARHCLRTEC